MTSENNIVGHETPIIVVDVELSQRTTGLMLSLFEVIYYERDPLEKIDSVLAVALAGPIDEYRDALDQALASSVRLANLGPEYHPEVIVRRLLTEVRFWNEQYLLEAFLCGNCEFRVLAALNLLWHDHADRLMAKCPVLAKMPDQEPGSFWMRRI